MTGSVMPSAKSDARAFHCLQKEAAQVYVDPALISTRRQAGDGDAQPQTAGQGGLALYPRRQPAPVSTDPRARARLQLRSTYVLPEDVFDLAADVMRHRLCCRTKRSPITWTATLLTRILNAIPTPEVSPRITMPSSPATTSLAITPERILRRLNGASFAVSTAIPGDYRTLFYGTGIDIAELRAATALDDDVRHID